VMSQSFQVVVWGQVEVEVVRGRRSEKRGSREYIVVVWVWDCVGRIEE
jgi:hypothetical protein